jgi:hypothetical protein
MMKTMKSKLEKLVILEGLKSDNASSEYDAEFSETMQSHACRVSELNLE